MYLSTDFNLYSQLRYERSGLLIRSSSLSVDHLYFRTFRFIHPLLSSFMRLICVFFCLLPLSAFGQQLKTENVFLITLDGLRWQELFTGADSLLIENEEYVDNGEHLSGLFWRKTARERRKALLPFFWGDLAQRGQLYGNRSLNCNVNVTNSGWFSYPGYSEILVGYVDPLIDSNDKIPNPNVTVLEFVNRQSGFEQHVAAFGSWDVFPYIINEKRSGIPVNAGFEDVSGEDLTDRERFLNELQQQIPSPWSTVRLDAFTHHYALEYLKKHHPRLLYIAYGETDDFAHDGNYEAYLNSANQTDAFIEDLWQYVQKDPFYRGNTTFLITTDHGRGTMPIDDWRSHGTDIKGADEIWIAALGPDTPAIGEVEGCSLYQNQIADTVARLLGLTYTTENPVGKAITTIFDP